MTDCNYIPGRRLPISYIDGSNLSCIDDSRFSVILLQSGLLGFHQNGAECYISGPMLLCLSDTSRFQVDYRYDINASVLSFAPEFINVNLSWDILRSAAWPTMLQKHNYPDMSLFMNLSQSYSGILPLYGDLFDKVASIFKNIKIQLREQPNRKWSCRTRSWLLILWNMLLEIYSVVYAQDESDGLSAQVCWYINAHLDEPLTIERLCCHFAINHTTLTRRFKEKQGMTINQYITESRLRNAKYHLEFTSLSTQEIAEMDGFRKASYLTRVFKAKLGLTPLEYRIAMREKRDQSVSRLFYIL